MKTAIDICEHIEEYFRETKRTPKETLAGLHDIFERVEMYIDALRSDGVEL